MKKKNTLATVIFFVVVGILLLTYFLTDRQGDIVRMGISDIFVNGVQSFSYFFEIMLFLLVVGGFYAVLNQTDAYRNLLSKIATKFKKSGFKFLMVVIAIFAVIASVTNFNLSLFLFVPFVVSIILLMGYSKVVALLSTVGAILVGNLGTLYFNFRNSNSNLFDVITLEETLRLDLNSNILPKLLILLGGIALLVWTVYELIKKESKKKKSESKTEGKKGKEKEKEILVEEKVEDTLLIGKENNNKKAKTTAMIIILSILFVVFVLGMLPWASLFELTIFDELHTTITEFEINGVGIYELIFSSSIPALGRWRALGDYTLLMGLILLFTVIVKIVYRIKFKDVIDSFIEGAKRLLPAALLTTLVYTVLISAYNHGFFETIVYEVNNLIGGFNIVITTLLAALGSFFHVDAFYAVQGGFYPILNLIEDTSLYPVLDVLLQGVYGVVMLFAPTSLLLVAGLTYQKVPYTEWLKAIWRLVLMLLALVLLVSIILMLL